MARERRSTREIQAEIERTRDAMGRTLGALEHELAPARIIGERIEMLHETLTEEPGRVRAFLSGYQAPLAVIGIGLGWLTWQIVMRREEAAGELPTAATLPAPPAAEPPAPGRLTRLVERHPVVAGGLLLLAGAALSQALPPGRRERDWLGALRGVLGDAVKAGNPGSDVS